VLERRNWLDAVSGDETSIKRQISLFSNFLNEISDCLEKVLFAKAVLQSSGFGYGDSSLLK
jgi:hypothetical protein